MMPKRIQRQRTKGWTLPDGAVYVGRPTRWGNPWKLHGDSGLARMPAILYPGKDWEYEGRISSAGIQHDWHHPTGKITEVHVRYMTRAEIVQCYRAYVTGGGWPIDWVPRNAPTVDEIRAELAGRDLVCWCPLDQPCHADVLLTLANTLPHAPACVSLIADWRTHPQNSVEYRLAEFAVEHTDAEIRDELITIFDEDPPDSEPVRWARALWPTLAIGGAR